MTPQIRIKRSERGGYDVLRLSSGCWKAASWLRGEKPWEESLVRRMLPQWRASGLQIDLHQAPELARKEDA